MGQFAALGSVISILAVVVSLNYEIAIPLGRNQREASSIFALTVGATILVSAVVTGIIAAAGPSILSLLGMKHLRTHAYFVAPMLVLLGLTRAVSFWLIRERAFRLSAAAKVAQAFSQSATQLAAGIVNPTAAGLLLGQLAAQLGFIAASGKGVFKSFILTTFSEVADAAKRHWRFPVITIWSNIINVAALNIPSLALITLHGAGPAGYFALCFRVLQMPVNFIGASISQVLYSSAVEAHAKGDLPSIVLGTLKSLNAFAFPVFCTLFLVAPGAFSLLFGSQWGAAGIYAQVLVPWVTVSLYASALSIIVSVINAQGREFYFQVFYLLTMAVLLLAASRLNNPTITVASISASAVLGLTPKIAWVLRISQVSLVAAVGSLAREAVYTVPLATSIILVLSFSSSPLGTLLFAAAALTANIGYNYKVRKIYEFYHEA
jgi:O-antigen/teichoic acid export membrane protein